MDAFILNKNGTDAARSGILLLHDAVVRREPGRIEAALSPDELFSRFRAADPTRNAACLPWLLRTYAAGGYRVEDLSKAYDTLAAFARLRGQLPNTATIDGETRNPRKLGSHLTLASLWSVIAPLVEAERLAQEDCSGEQVDTDRERALSQSRVIHRSDRMVIAVPMTEEASCWWGLGTQWCTAARKNNAFEHYHSIAPLIVICLRKNGDLPARKLQLHVHAGYIQFTDENDARVLPELILERWHDLEMLLHWAVSRNGLVLKCIPEPLRTEAVCLAAVGRDGVALIFVPEPLRTEAMCLTAVKQNGRALQYVPEHLCTEAICTAAVTEYGHALEFVPRLLRTEAICTAAVTEYGRALEFVPIPLRTQEMCLAGVGSNGAALQYLPEHLRTEAMCLTAVEQDGSALSYVPDPMRTEAVCLVAVSKDGLALKYVPKSLRTEVICSAAVTEYGGALEYVPEHLCTEAMFLTVIGRNGWPLRYVPECLKTEAVCLAAVGKNGDSLQYVPEPLRTEALCLAAVCNDGRALKYVPESVYTDAICLAAVSSNGNALPFIPVPLRTEAIRLTAISRDKQRTNIPKSHDLLLSDMENCLNKL